MTLAPQELENTASKFAAEAIKLDSQGSQSSAISSYQRATEALIKLVLSELAIQLKQSHLLQPGHVGDRKVGASLFILGVVDI